MSPSNRLLRVLLILSLLVGSMLLSGCTTRLAYSQLDRIVVWKLRDFISLEAPSKARMQELLAERLEWHCRTELPEYVRLLQDIHNALDTGALSRSTYVPTAMAPTAISLTPLTPSALVSPNGPANELRDFVGQIEARWMALMGVVATDVAEILAFATQNERQSLYLKLAEQHQKNWETYVHPTKQERLASRSKRMEKRARQWLGRLNADQRAAIATWSEALADHPEFWLAHRSQWNSLLQATVERNLGDPTRLSTDLETLFASPSTLWTPEYRQVVELNTDRTIGLLEQLIDAATSDQLSRAQERLTSLARDLDRAKCSSQRRQATSQDSLPTAIDSRLSR